MVKNKASQKTDFQTPLVGLNENLIQQDIFFLVRRKKGYSKDIPGFSKKLRRIEAARKVQTRSWRVGAKRKKKRGNSLVSTPPLKGAA